MAYSTSFRLSSSGLVVLALSGCASGSVSTAVDEGISPETYSPSAFAAVCEPWDDWEKPAPPFRVYGGAYYVGTCGISAILITSPEGHLLIDSGTRLGGELVAASIRELGFSLGDVRYLTHTQEHGDHIGGVAYLKESTGARLVASPRARSVFETGVLNTDDPQYTPEEPRAWLSVDRVVADGEALELDNRSVVAHFTPGHSPGAISWRWEECENSQCRTILFTDGLGPFSADGYRWTDNPEYLADYRESVTWLEDVEVDICLAAHPSQVRLIERIQAGMLVDSDECRRNGASIQGRIDIIVAEERGR